MVDAGFGSAPPTLEQLQSILTTQAPPPEAVVATAGAAGQAARGDHQHPRLTSTTVQTLGVNGDVAITFTRSFSKMPGVVCTAYKETDNLPVTFEVKSWMQDANLNYIGCTIHGGKAQTLPNVAGVVLLTNLISALNSFNPFSGNAQGTQFSCVAIQASN
ncbi:MAG: hypothetical protein ACRYGK_15505 [Janthinobacterium lividum]